MIPEQLSITIVTITTTTHTTTTNNNETGNIIKMDRHKYIRVAFHGFTKLKSEERKRVYLDGEKKVRPNRNNTPLVGCCSSGALARLLLAVSVSSLLLCFAEARSRVVVALTE